MAASKTSSTSSRSDATDATSEAARPADMAGMQQVFEQWLNAWRSVADPAQWTQFTQQMNGGNGNAAGNGAAANPFAAFAVAQGATPFAMPPLPDFAKLGTMPDFSKLAGQMPGFAGGFAQMPGMPSMPPIPNAALAPERLQQLQADYSRDVVELLKQAGAQSIDPAALKDRRFSTTAWQSTPAYAFTAAWYLLNARYLQELANAVDTDPKTRERIRFTVEQWTAAASPSNFLAFNPEAQKTLIESKGESLWQGMMNLLNDLQRGKISQSDESRFVVGQNIGATEGAVVFENDLVQLIHYKPHTSQVFERPLLIVPPCINKFYILDLQPESSLVGHALDAGHQVFILSWRNADQSVAHKTWDDYVQEGVLEPIEIVKQITGREQINTLGFCIGGTILSTALAVAAARGEHPAASMTLLTAMLDFSDTGVLDVFVDEAHVQMREQTIGGKNGAPAGLMRGVEFANTFSYLRPNDLVWNYVVDNYLKGRTPQAFDLLFWNSDSTNLPGPMCVWYLRNTYLENRLREPNALTTCGEAIDLSRIDVPTFIYGSREDHIVPWASAYASAPLLSGPQTFVLGASGHIAGVINPPSKNKRSFWMIDSEDKRLPADPDDWLAAATEHPGSWWPAWTNWLDGYAGKKTKAPASLGSKHYPVIEPAPGRYVLQRDH
ncbi:MULTISPECIES: class I poly(R)-hydroxyalkanoic acid synthase [unclassified Caballeronia]|uniref:class I poly(R)-hydroxyalkanoic acid synthase n=1 Tax=unclassified Caballeronia TaxID=2646786 RepID=UPI00285D83F0|nr:MULTISPECIES: class I poly(R)-hydroxyalkanoic acid synthase [unclassified Caballeronia]MDR5750483.1 class I poly(R)-hydroxyalkanoic acid synthase [Caballeronia sp. LZ024]MDR5842484.1 class I poly(R)-hydroxyalkanoic acid synthase [Caballeronia sp. LZ031]